MIQSIPSELVSFVGRLRQPDGKRVQVLAESIKEVGLLNPITVYRTTIIRGGQDVDGYGLIAGMHRLRACQSLGWDEVPAVVVDLEENQRVIAECDENLCVNELSPSDRALFTARRKAAYEALHPEAKHGGDRKSDQVANIATRSFSEDQSEKTGQAERTVRQYAERGEKVTTAALAMVKGTRLDTGKFLDMLKSVPPDRQTEVVRRHLAETSPATSRRDPPKVIEAESDEEAVERQVASLMSAWNKAGPDARAEFLSRIGGAA